MSKRKAEHAVLRDLVVEFGSVVDKGANPGADIVLFKRDASADDTATEATIAAAVVTDTLEKVGRKMAGPRLNALKAAVEHLNRILGEVDSSSADEDDEEDDKHMSKKEAAAVAEPQVEKSAEPVVAVEVSKDDSIAKMQAQIETLTKRAQDAEDIAKAERDARLTAEWIQKARAYTALPTTPDTLGPVLKRANGALSAEDFGELERLFKAACEHIEQSAMYREVGKSGTAGDESATAKLNKRATEMVAAKEARDYADAISKIQRDPASRELIEAWNRERH